MSFLAYFVEGEMTEMTVTTVTTVTTVPPQIFGHNDSLFLRVPTPSLHAARAATAASAATSMAGIIDSIPPPSAPPRLVDVLHGSGQM